jgi:hypothetical protein
MKDIHRRAQHNNAFTLAVLVSVEGISIRHDNFKNRSIRLDAFTV